MGGGQHPDEGQRPPEQKMTEASFTQKAQGGVVFTVDG